MTDTTVAKAAPATPTPASRLDRWGPRVACALVVVAVAALATLALPWYQASSGPTQGRTLSGHLVRLNGFTVQVSGWQLAHQHLSAAAAHLPTSTQVAPAAPASLFGVLMPVAVLCLMMLLAGAGVALRAPLLAIVGTLLAWVGTGRYMGALVALMDRSGPQASLPMLHQHMAGFGAFDVAWHLGLVVAIAGCVIAAVQRHRAKEAAKAAALAAGENPPTSPIERLGGGLIASLARFVEHGPAAQSASTGKD